MSWLIFLKTQFLLLWLLELCEMSRYGFHSNCRSDFFCLFAWLALVWFVQISLFVCFSHLSNTENILAKLWKSVNFSLIWNSPPLDCFEENSLIFLFLKPWVFFLTLMSVCLRELHLSYFRPILYVLPDSREHLTHRSCSEQHFSFEGFYWFCHAGTKHLWTRTR